MWVRCAFTVASVISSRLAASRLRGSGRVEWTSLGGLATLSECEKEQALHAKKGDMLAKIEVSSGRMPSYVAWRCLPDTVDLTP
jgi:hypothetical protein